MEKVRPSALATQASTGFTAGKGIQSPPRERAARNEQPPWQGSCRSPDCARAEHWRSATTIHTSISTMAALRAPSASFLAAFLPVARERLIHEPATRRIPLLQQIQQLRINASLSPLLPAALAPIPSLLGQLWEGVLRAVPKKKTSHMKKRHRQMAGKALKDVTALNKCSACGRTKRAHILCPYCVTSRSSKVDGEMLRY